MLTLRSHVETAHRQTGERSQVALAQLALFAQLPHGCAKRGEDPRVASAPESGGAGSAVNSSHVHERASPTAPWIENVHSSGGVRGVGPADRTG